MALQYAYETLKSDKEIVVAAVKEWRRAFEYADEKLKDDMRRVLVLAPAGKKVSFLTKLKLCTILRDSKLKLNEALEIREHLV